MVLLSLGAFALIAAVTAVLMPGLHARFYPLLPDKGAAWYFWQLPATGTINRISYWGGYAAHQLVLWVLLAYARRQSAAEPSAVAEGTANRRVAGRPIGTTVTRTNLIILGVNVLFVALHLLQTQLWYDGLAQDVPIWSSQGSVIVMLVIVLYMMIPRRGLFWGKGRRLVSSGSATYGFVRRWHGLYISWAVVYTFWFHPMDGNWGLLSGFIYMFLLFIQLSLFNTRFHLNMAWIALLEVFVAIHGTLITVFKDNPVWPMFLFGFMFMFTFTQIHAWNSGPKKLPAWIRWANLALFAAAYLLVYALVRGFNHWFELLFIPSALYGGALALVGIDALVEVIRGRIRGGTPAPAVE